MFKNLSLKNRIALFYSFTFSIVLLIIFAFIYYTVNHGINKTLYEILKEETNHHFDYVLHEPTLEHYVHPHEWEEVEHTDVALNPVFIAIYNQEFQLVENSPNLVQNKLEWNKNQKENAPYLANYNTVELLISQTKLIHHGEVVGYLVVGVSTKHNQLALGYLKTGLMIIFPLSIVMIFISARLIAGQSTKPVFSIIKTAKKITENNLSERITLPKNKDELYLLSITINFLVERLETQLQKAKQFSADASHELRTPLAVVKGTLEILIRKKRTIEEYNEKINYTLKQVERLERLVEQFLVLSRVENNSIELKPSTFEVKNEVLKSIERFQVFLEEKQISVFTSDICTHSTENFKELFEIIIDNILSNAIKYSNLKGKITVSSFIKNNMYFLSFQDNGIGIDEKELQMIQNRFYRINTNSSPDHTGTGLGLNIATQLANISGIQLKIESQKKIGTIIFISLKLK